jgi:O-antigen ligase
VVLASRPLLRAPAHPYRATDIVVVLIAVLLLISTIQTFGEDRGTIANTAAMDPLALIKMGVRLIALAATWYLWRKSPGSLRASLSGPTVWFLAFFGFAALTALYSANPFVSASRAISFAIVLVFATTAAAAYARQGREAAYWRGVCLVLLLTAVPLLAVVIGLGRVMASYDSVARLGGIYQPNQLGAFAGLVLLTCIMCLLRRRLVVLSACLLPVAAGVALYTLSRGSWIAITVGLFAAWWSVKRLRIWTVPALGLLLATGALGVETGVFDSNHGLFAAVRRGQSSSELLSGTGRTGLYTYLLERQFPKRPILGFGYQMLSDEDVAGDLKPEETQIARELGWPAEQGHNLFLSTLIGTGLVGLALFLAALGNLLWRTYRSARSGDPIAVEQLVLLAAILAHAMVDTTLVTGVDHAFLLLSAVTGLASARVALRFRPSAAPAAQPLMSRRPLTPLTARSTRF